MKTVGIICEYNPLHLGHRKQLEAIRARFGPDTAIVCAMSGNFVQRGAPAILSKSPRAMAAILCGADLVLELPVTTSLQSAEGFAAGGVKILSQFCDTLCFGSESADADALLSTAQALLSEEYPPLLRRALDSGCSFPAAQQAALAELGLPGITLPNDILGVEYCKAILSQSSPMEILPIRREGSYHAETADMENPSATAIRNLMLYSHNWLPFVPKEARHIFQQAPHHSLAAGERAILARLRTMTDAEFEALPYGSEGLWRRLMHASRQEATLEDILSRTKSKRYTRSRLDRMVMCAFLGLTQTDMEAQVPYTRVLAFNARGRRLLNKAKKHAAFPNTGEAVDHPHWCIEQRCGALFGLFNTNGPAFPQVESCSRVYYHR